MLVIDALLDSPSAAGAFRFTLRPGAETVMDSEMALYPRVDLTQAGLAPITSMFFFDANNRTGFDDYRAAVHDSHGLSMLTGKGEHIWRNLNNPRVLQISAFQDASPRGSAWSSARGISSTTRIWKRFTKSGRRCGPNRSATGARAR